MTELGFWSKAASPLMKPCEISCLVRRRRGLTQSGMAPCRCVQPRRLETDCTACSSTLATHTLGLHLPTRHVDLPPISHKGVLIFIRPYRQSGGNVVITPQISFLSCSMGVAFTQPKPFHSHNRTQNSTAQHSTSHHITTLLCCALLCVVKHPPTYLFLRTLQVPS